MLAKYQSLPARGAWIEIPYLHTNRSIKRRSPQGERGLKFAIQWALYRPLLSLPARGAWIEISYLSRLNLLILSLPARGAWIEICT